MNDHERDKLRQRIEDSDIDGKIRQNLLVRLKVASHIGVAAIIREFERAMVERRKQVCQSHRRFYSGLSPSPRNKQMVTLDVK